MARRLIKTFTSDDGQKQARVYRDSEWNEYRVRFHKLSDAVWVLQPAADYHTDDKRDAEQSAFMMVGCPTKPRTVIMDHLTAQTVASWVNTHDQPEAAEVVQFGTDQQAYAVRIHSTELNTRTGEARVVSNVAYSYADARNILGY